MVAIFFARVLAGEADAQSTPAKAPATTAACATTSTCRTWRGRQPARAARHDPAPVHERRHGPAARPRASSPRDHLRVAEREVPLDASAPLRAGDLERSVLDPTLPRTRPRPSRAAGGGADETQPRLDASGLSRERAPARLFLLVAACATAPASHVPKTPTVAAPAVEQTLAVYEAARTPRLRTAPRTSRATRRSPSSIEDEAPHAEDARARTDGRKRPASARRLDRRTHRRRGPRGPAVARLDLAWATQRRRALDRRRSGAALAALQARQSGGRLWHRGDAALPQRRDPARCTREFPGTPPLSLGHISARTADRWPAHQPPVGPRRRHRLLLHELRALVRRAHRDNLDLPRTWAFVRALVTRDRRRDDPHRSLDPALLRGTRSRAGEDAEWVDSLFRASRQAPADRSSRAGPRDAHPRSVLQPHRARDGAPLLRRARVRRQGEAPVTFVRYRAKKGDTLGKLAKKFGVSLAALKAANGLRKSLIRERAEYRIPVKAGAARPPLAPLRFPNRRLPSDAVGAVGSDRRLSANTHTYAHIPAGQGSTPLRPRTVTHLFQWSSRRRLRAWCGVIPWSARSPLTACACVYREPYSLPSASSTSRTPALERSSSAPPPCSPRSKPSPWSRGSKSTVAILRPPD